MLDRPFKMLEKPGFSVQLIPSSRSQEIVSGSDATPFQYPVSKPLAREDRNRSSSNTSTHSEHTVRSNGAGITELYKQLANQRSGDKSAADRTANLVLKLWCMINVREPEASLVTTQTPILQWKQGQTLGDSVSDTFSTSRWKIEANDSRLHPSFTAAFMVNI